MKLKEVLEKYDDIEISEEKIKELKELLGIKESKKWKPLFKTTYYAIDRISMKDISFVWSETAGDEIAYIYNNCFKSREEAKFRLKQIKVYNELKNFAIENNECEIDWNNSNQDKYSIWYSHNCQTFEIHTVNSLMDIGQIYFTSKELVEQAIEQVGEERIKKYLFGVI